MSLGESASGLVFDSGTFTNAEQGLTHLAALFSSPHTHAHLFDLNWQQVLAGREARAQVFDHKDVLTMRRAGPEPDSGGVHSAPFQVVITQHESHTEALLLVGWLSSRLGWDLTPLAHDRWVGHAGERGTVVVNLKSVEDGLPGLREVDIKAHKFSLKLERSEDNQFITSPRSSARRGLPRTRGALIC